jgi:hypothetical protein
MTPIATKNPLTLVEYFRQHQLFSHQLLQMKTIYILSKKQVFDTTQSITEKLEEQPFKV